MSQEGIHYFSWEGRPAVIARTGCWFRPTSGGDWRPADAAEVIESGVSLSQDAFLEAFPTAGLPNSVEKRSDSHIDEPPSSPARRAVGVAAGILAGAVIFWFAPDLVTLAGGRFDQRSPLTTLALLVLVLVAGVQVGAKVGWGKWSEDHTWPAWRSGVMLVVALVVLFISVPYQ